LPHGQSVGRIIYGRGVTFPRPTASTGPLAGHVRKGRTYRSPLAATGALHVGDWVRDDVPDLLWPVLTLAELGTQGAAGFLRWQEDVQADLRGKAEPRFLADCLDGRLTSLDKLVAQIPGAKTAVKKRANERGLLPDSVARALASYPERPASWLVASDMTPSAQAEIDLVARALLELLKDGHREAVIKCLRIWSSAQAGTLSAGPELIELLKPYPNDPDTRSQADSAIRASWGAHKAAVSQGDPTHFDASIRWAKVFWGVNSMTTRCVRRRETYDSGRNPQRSADASPTATGGSRDDTAPIGTPGDELRQLAMDLVSSYVEALETSPARLYDQEPQEVHSGLVTRAGREVIAALGSRDLWCMEHGAHVVRVLVEVRVYLEWMARQEPSIYRAFQEYGAGKAKLYARLMDELPDEARQPDFEGAIAELERLSHNHDVLDHRVVDTRDSFAEGKSIRTMAEECDLLDFYRHSYYMASGVAHSEWWSVETHAMERCLNILHRGHLIPSLSLNGGENLALARSWVDQLYALIRVSLRVLGTATDAVTEAFSWLEEERAPNAEAATTASSANG